MPWIGALSRWRGEELRTNLWLVPSVEVLLAIGLFLGTINLDRAVYNGRFHAPTWVISGTADAARQILTAIAASVITVVGIVFSMTIVMLTLASTQFGPRMLCNFHPRPGYSVHARNVRGDVRLLRARPRFDWTW